MNGWKDKGVKEGVRGRNRSRREKHRKVTGEGRKVSMLYHVIVFNSVAYFCVIEHNAILNYHG